MSPKHEPSLPHHPAWLLLWLPLLVGLQGVPHTGGLRTLALLAGVIHVIALHCTSRPSQPLAQDRFVTLTFWFLVIWLIYQTAFIAPVPIAAIKALAGDWWKIILMAMLGLGLSKAIKQPVWLYVAMFAGAFLHVCSIFGYQANALLHGRGIIFQRSLLSEYPLASYFCVSAIIWLLTDAISRHRYKSPLFPWSLRVSLALLGMALLAEALLRTKSGHVMLAVIGLTSAVTVLAAPGDNRTRRLATTLALLTVLAGATLLMSGERWAGLAQSLQAAQTGDFPLQAFVTDDTPIPAGANHSFYLRALRGWQGIEGAIEHPLGIGYGPDVYRRYLNTRFGLDDGILSSNSGLIDFTLAVGSPGLVLLLLLCAGLIRRGWQAFTQGQISGLVLMMLVIHQLGHYTLDSTLGGSRLTGPVLAIAALWGLSRKGLSKQ